MGQVFRHTTAICQKFSIFVKKALATLLSRP